MNHEDYVEYTKADTLISDAHKVFVAAFFFQKCFSFHISAALGEEMCVCFGPFFCLRFIYFWFEFFVI